MSAADNRCPQNIEEIAEAYVLGRLPDAEAAAFEEHYMACRDCADAALAAEQFVQAMRAAGQMLDRELVTNRERLFVEAASASAERP